MIHSNNPLDRWADGFGKFLKGEGPYEPKPIYEGGPTVEDIKRENAAFLADDNCRYCHGSGFMTRPNGPDDYDSEECVCLR